VSVSRWASRGKEGNISRVNGVGVTYDIASHKTGIDNLLHGVSERVFYVNVEGTFNTPLCPDKKFFRHRLRKQGAAIIHGLPIGIRATYEEFVNSYVGMKRVTYKKAAESLLIEPVGVKDAQVKVFIKREKTNFTARPDAVPRIISPRSPRYNVELGRFIKHHEQDIAHAVDSMFGSQTITKGLNCRQLGQLVQEKWNKIDDPVAVGLDASRFDQHVSEAALEWEHELYLSMYDGEEKKELAKLLNMQLVNNGVGRTYDGQLKYRRRGTRCSGDMNTGIGNCVLMSSMVHAYCRSRAIRQFELLNNGDDCVVILSRRNLATFTANLARWFGMMGFTLVVEEPVYDIEKIEFCQTRPVRIGGEYRMVRNPLMGLSKDSISVKPLTSEFLYMTWLASVGEGGLAMASGVPIYQSLYKAYLNTVSTYSEVYTTRFTRAVARLRNEYSGFNFMSAGLHPREQTITAEDRYSFWLAFGVLPDVQIMNEQHYDNKLFPYNKSYQPLDQLEEVDVQRVLLHNVDG